MLHQNVHHRFCCVKISGIDLIIGAIAIKISFLWFCNYELFRQTVIENKKKLEEFFETN